MKKIMDNLKEIIEGILFVSGDGVAFSDIAEKLNVEIEEVASAVDELKKDREETQSGIQVVVFNNKAQLSSNKAYVNEIAEVLNPIRERALTKTVLEVLSIIAYKQPITRMEIEAIRESKNCDYAVNALLENDLICVVGRKDTVGKPLEFGTTDNFLKKFGLTSIGDLPEYEELLERIQIIKESYKKEDSSLFNFNNMPEDIANQDKIDEEAEIDEEDILNNLTTLDSEEEIYDFDDDATFV
ncbi:MAG: SMC-Scp complex subunit ScpB [Clostridiales bacterium]|nr:SMC-Scp complex subunit ScpB [Clostridiales bacterium]